MSSNGRFIFRNAKRIPLVASDEEQTFSDHSSLATPTARARGQNILGDAGALLRRRGLAARHRIANLKWEMPFSAPLSSSWSTFIFDYNSFQPYMKAIHGIRNESYIPISTLSIQRIPPSFLTPLSHILCFRFRIRSGPVVANNDLGASSGVLDGVQGRDVPFETVRNSNARSPQREGTRPQRFYASRLEMHFPCAEGFKHFRSRSRHGQRVPGSRDACNRCCPCCRP